MTIMEIVESVVYDYQAGVITRDEAVARIETETGGGITAEGAKSYLEQPLGTFTSRPGMYSSIPEGGYTSEFETEPRQTPPS